MYMSLLTSKVYVGTNMYLYNRLCNLTLCYAQYLSISTVQTKKEIILDMPILLTPLGNYFPLLHIQ
jgi:hypothetical protein